MLAHWLHSHEAWAETARALKPARETFAKLGVRLSGSELEFSEANAWKAQVVKRMTDGVWFLFRANGVEWVKGTRVFTDPHTLAVDTGENVSFDSAIIATGSMRLWPQIAGLQSDRCVDSEGCWRRPKFQNDW